MTLHAWAVNSGFVTTWVWLQAALEGDADVELLREQVRVIADELERREGVIEQLQAGGFGPADEDQEVELQVCCHRRPRNSAFEATSYNPRPVRMPGSPDIDFTMW